MFHTRDLFGAASTLLLLIILLLLDKGLCLIPEQCAHNVTKPFSVCCPVSPHNHLVCGGPKRGYCEKIAVPKDYVPHVFHMDDRLSWPLRFFSHACQCKGNFFGTACEKCWYGWTGPNCDKRVKRIRRDIHSLSDHELYVLKDVLYRSQTWPSGYVVLDESDNYHSDPLYKPRFIPASVQYFITFNHRYGSRATLYKNKQDCEMYGILNYNHDGVVFPTWHRYLQLIWEGLLAEIAWKVHRVENFAAPYWDMIGLLNCDICTNTYFGAPGREDKDGLHISRRSIFSNFTEFCAEPRGDAKCYGCQRSGRKTTITRKFTTLKFPDQRDLDYVLSLKK
ncbi:unnamed protein product [Echinostoma caproni]|uniref:Tyrosinase_Cu-bd domain-containing protein n=1 Tax=Echinostoma caproni TaxID=27848 RepID=A0A183B7C7_9TREM|nr:unnamed protein product [Echinostoma caproni]